MSEKDKLISVEHLKWNVSGIECGTLTVDYLNWILDHEEPAVDAVPVIRCKDCKHHYYHELLKQDYCDIPNMQFGEIDPNGYCHRAEKNNKKVD